MTMHKPSLNALEYPKILELLAKQTSFSASRALALALEPSSDPLEVRRRQAATSESLQLLQRRSSIGVGGARDVRPLVDRAEREGLLEPHNFLEILDTLRAAGQLRRALQSLDESFPRMRSLLPGLYPLPPLQQAIERCIGLQGEVLDSASSRLAGVRAEIRVLQNRLGERMQSLLKRYHNYLQEAIITQRQGRYVLAVKAGNKRSVRGLVHDYSSSGATLYIEPLEVVDMGNELRELQLEEEEEVRRVLFELSEQVAASAEAIHETVATLAQADLALAKGRFSIALKGEEPGLVLRREKGVELLPPTHSGQGEWPAGTALPPHEPPLLLQQARHPLLDPATVVPTDVYLGGDFRVLVITGPNTGGKTVALKTVGLLTLMAQAGLHLPAAAGSRLPPMRQVFADIGDEQSIEQSLSTFSSHMTRIIQVLEQAGADSLVLLDELGAGTDPVEGSALARSLIEALLERNCLALTTTHHSELKAYAHATPQVENASVEFDVETLSPTYVLTIGLPGRSNALAIASRLGLAPAIIERARDWVGEGEIEIDSLLQQIHQERELTQQALEEATQARQHAHSLERRLEREIRQLEQERREILAQTRQEAQEAIEEVQTRLAFLERDLSTVRVTREWMTQARQQIQETREFVPDLPPAPQASEVRLLDEDEDLEVGDIVWVESLDAYGEVLAAPDSTGEAEVQVGSFKMRRPLTDLRQADKEDRRTVSVHTPDPPSAPEMELDMRGWRAAEVQNLLERYLNDAYLSGMPFVRLIHGKGTGVLRRVVREFLEGHPLVKSFAGAPDPDGGEGVTVVHLVSR
ncbi:MAG: Smr/MutS family protein [Chloroflexia bacterium]|nr:Smr/MutS family protein [Chloroflexia bacterium]